MPQLTAPVKLIFDRSQRMSDDQFFEFCILNSDVPIERSPEGEILILPPAGLETAYRITKVAVRLFSWADKNRHGKAFGANAGFILPGGAMYSPDAAWVSNERLSGMTKEQLRKFPPLCPNFVIEVKSRSDRLTRAKAKMAAWIAEGIERGWLIDGDHQTVYIYRAGSPEPEKRTGIKTFSGEGPVAGFKLDLTDIWAGL